MKEDNWTVENLMLLSKEQLVKWVLEWRKFSDEAMKLLEEFNKESKEL